MVEETDTYECGRLNNVLRHSGKVRVERNAKNIGRSLLTGLMIRISSCFKRFRNAALRHHQQKNKNEAMMSHSCLHLLTCGKCSVDSLANNVTCRTVRQCTHPLGSLFCSQVSRCINRTMIIERSFSQKDIFKDYVVKDGQTSNSTTCHNFNLVLHCVLQTNVLSTHKIFKCSTFSSRGVVKDGSQLNNNVLKSDKSLQKLLTSKQSTSLEDTNSCKSKSMIKYSNT